MTDPNRRVRVAAAHAASPLLDKNACVDKACALIADAAADGARFLVFPESFIPGFPMWNALVRPIDGHEWFVRMARNSLRVDATQFAVVQNILNALLLLLDALDGKLIADESQR